MPSTVTGNVTVGVNLTTTFTSGTAGTARETNNIGTTADTVGPSFAEGLQLADCWSQTYANVAAPFTIDLTALPGIGGRTVDFSAIGVRLLLAINSDPTEGHDFTIEPGASDGFDGMFDSIAVPGGMPGAGVASNGQPVGNKVFKGCFTASGITVDPTHKTLTIDPGPSTIASLTVVIAG